MAVEERWKDLEKFLVIENAHAAECGAFPKWARERPADSYFGYFENQHGEQWLLVATREKVRLAGGDCGWNRTYEMNQPAWTEIGEGRFGGWPAVILNREERSWLATCLMGVAHRWMHLPLKGAATPGAIGETHS